jgi:hypothetical protein
LEQAVAGARKKQRAKTWEVLGCSNADEQRQYRLAVNKHLRVYRSVDHPVDSYVHWTQRPISGAVFCPSGKDVACPGNVCPASVEPLFEDPVRKGFVWGSEGREDLAELPDWMWRFIIQVSAQLIRARECEYLFSRIVANFHDQLSDIVV